MLGYLKLWGRCRSGATGLEYGLLAGGIALAIVAASLALGADIDTIFSALSGSMDEAAANGP